MSATKCIERGRREHEDLVAEFRSLMSGVEATLQSTGMTLSRMSGDDLFLEIKRALHPLGTTGSLIDVQKPRSFTKAPEAKWPTSTSRTNSMSI